MVVKMKYCNSCILPDTRPNLVIDDSGICNACNTYDLVKPNINWNKRKKAFHKVVDYAKSRSHGYDCVIPVSGGKDSHWQVIKCLEFGLNPLAVTWKTPARTAIGHYNLNNLIKLGVDHIDYQINPNVEKKFMHLSLIRYGSTAIPMHMALINIPIKIASKFDIPLIVWGENSAFEYGSKDEELEGFSLDSEWVKYFGVTHGTTAKDWISKELNEKNLTAYFEVNSDELNKKGIKAIFLGYYFKWDPDTSLKNAVESGFKHRDEGPKVGYYNYADIDDDFISIHHFLKLYKFGFTRLFDNLSIEIRNKRMTRNKALKIVKKYGFQKPVDDIKKLCAFLSISEDQFSKIIEKFRNKDIWYKDKGIWKIRNFIIPDWDWGK
jgi:N-acetyl sugar amidotransferase